MKTKFKVGDYIIYKDNTKHDIILKVIKIYRSIGSRPHNGPLKYRLLIVTAISNNFFVEDVSYIDSCCIILPIIKKLLFCRDLNDKV